MDRMQRMSLISLSLVVVLAIGLSLKSFGARLRAPFGLKPAVAEQDVAALEAEALLRLKITDTDKDSLSDYDELYAYKTSPYIPDSDSDTYPDGEEVRTGNDPNCPKGNNCATGIVSVGITPTDTTGSADATAAVNPYTISDPTQIRALIASTGAVSAAELAQIDDATLLEMWEQVKKTIPPPDSIAGSMGVVTPTPPLRQGSAGQAATDTQNTAAAGTPAQSGKLPINPPVAEVRKLLEASGISKEVLNSVNDATLMKLYEETRLEQEAKNP